MQCLDLSPKTALERAEVRTKHLSATHSSSCTFSEKNPAASRCYRQVLLSVPICFEALPGIWIWKVVQSQKEHGQQQFHVWPHVCLHVPGATSISTCTHSHTHISVHRQCRWLMKVTPNKILQYLWRCSKFKMLPAIPIMLPVSYSWLPHGVLSP